MSDSERGLEGGKLSSMVAANGDLIASISSALGRPVFLYKNRRKEAKVKERRRNRSKCII